jgi:exodeoxyribonuclease VII small subunit
MSKIKQSYAQALSELELILSDLEKNETIDIDLVEKKVKRAAELISICKSQLTKIDEDLDKVLNELE